MNGVNLFVELAAYIPVVGGAAVAVGLLVDFCKTLGLPDGYAPAVSAGLNVVAYIAYYFVEDKRALDDILSAANIILPYVFSLFVSLMATNVAHRAALWLGMGYSHSAKAAA